MVTEFGLTPGSFEGGTGDPALFTRGDDTIVTPSRWSRDRLVDWGFPDGKIEGRPTRRGRRCLRPPASR